MKIKALSLLILCLTLGCLLPADAEKTPAEPPLSEQAEPCENTDFIAVEEATEEPAELPGEPGFFWVEGALYCRGEDGMLLCGEEKDGLFFTENGAYSSGSEELDTLVAQTLDAIMEANPEHSGTELLRDVYDYLLKNCAYLGKRAPAADGTFWETEAALEMLKTGKGNCHHYAAAFWALSRGLGYNAVTHTNRNGQQHSWTEIEIDSVPYIFDPQLAAHWMDDRFMLSYETCRKRNYSVYASSTALH